MFLFLVSSNLFCICIFQTCMQVVAKSSALIISHPFYGKSRCFNFRTLSHGSLLIQNFTSYISILSVFFTFSYLSSDDGPVCWKGDNL